MHEKYMVYKPDKGHLLTLGFNESFPDIVLNNSIIENLTEEKILENKLHFKSLLKNICIKSNQKLSALSRISKLKTLNQRGNVVNSQFPNFFLIWILILMFKRIDKIHEYFMIMILNFMIYFPY